MMGKQATFRFYEELNDFLPPEKRKVPFVYSFQGTPSVKALIEAIGIPHAEVDLVLVNGASVDFKYLVQDKDFISVYPVFETLEISGVTHLRDKPLRELRFILDVHLGRLAKYLRMFGFDCLYRNDLGDSEIIRLSAGDHRVILTRDVSLLKVGAVTHGYFVRSQEPKEQLAEVLRHFDLFRSLHPFSRCIKCNGSLRGVSRGEVLDRLQPLTARYYSRFFICEGCGTIFWEGSHFKSISRFVESVRNSLAPPGPEN